MKKVKILHGTELFLLLWFFPGIKVKILLNLESPIEKPPWLPCADLYINYIYLYIFFTYSIEIFYQIIYLIFQIKTHLGNQMKNVTNYPLILYIGVLRKNGSTPTNLFNIIFLIQNFTEKILKLNNANLLFFFNKIDLILFNIC